MPGFGLPLAYTTLPNPQNTLGAQYAIQVNQVLQALIDACTDKLVPGQLQLSAAVDVFNQPLQRVGYVGLYANGASVGVARSVFFIGDELYTIDGAGRLVQITQGGALNSAAIGGIVGDYGPGFPTNLVTAVAGTTRYVFTVASVPAYVQAKGFIWTDSAGNQAKVDPPATITAHASKWLATIPGAGTKLLSIDSTGQIAHSATVDAFTLTSNNDITLVGTGKLKHGSYDYAQGCIPRRMTGTSALTQTEVTQPSAADTVDLIIANGLVVGARIIGFKVESNKTVAGNYSFQLHEIIDGGLGSVETAAVRTSTGGWATTTKTLATPRVVAAKAAYFVRCTPDFANALTAAGNVTLTLDQN